MRSLGLLVPQSLLSFHLTPSIKYLADRLTGLEINASLVDYITLYTFLAALVISIVLNLRDYLKRGKYR